MPVLIDAAVLDIGVVVQAGEQHRILTQPGPRTGTAGLTARESALLNAVYAAYQA